MRGPRRLAVYVVAGTAGVVVAHMAGYAAAIPHAHERAEHLHATGHSYWPAAIVLALIAGCGALGLAVHAGRRRALGRLAVPDLSVTRLAAFQVGLFACIEIVERLGAGAPVAELAHGSEFAVGLLVQVAVAAVVCRLFRGVAAVSERVARRSRAPLAPARSPFRAVLHQECRSTGVAVPVGSRAPPSLAVG